MYGDFILFVPAQGAKDGGFNDGHGAGEGQVGAFRSCARGSHGHVRQVQGASECEGRDGDGGGGGAGEPIAGRRAVQRGKQFKAEQTIFAKGASIYDARKISRIFDPLPLSFCLLRCMQHP